VNIGFDPGTLERAAEAACRAALRAGLPEVDARDLAQDALVRALTSARPPAGVALSAWVYGIARNLGRDHAKSAQRREVPMQPPDSARDDDLATVLAVRRAIDQLPEPLRDVITLHELEDNSLRETAEALQIPFDTAKDRLRRAREQLRVALGDNATELASERAHTRRRAAAYGAAIVAGVYATLGAPTVASAASGGIAVAATGVRTVPLWMAVTAVGALVGAGALLGRLTAPGHGPEIAPPTMSIAASADRATGAAAADLVAGAPAVRTPTPTPTPVTAPRPSTNNDRTPTALPSTATQPRPAARATSAVGPPSSGPVPDHGDAEHLLVDRARAGLRRGMHDEALVSLMAHARTFPSGALAEERDVLIIEAYLGSNSLPLARRTIDRYRANHPTGVLRARVDALAGQLE
jgi:RNA polymerase sigma factor (sigma-70 family)